mmetsp:Transcript_54060/g.167798  ORF Transcript_54060/g.167798 Transcript_54060/m.167798 type:complete len:379 (+) Transcript_54060:56-1192(+)
MDAAPRGRAAGPSMLLPSGEDANPLNRRLPAEVVARRRPKERGQKVEERVPEDVELDLKVVLTLKPEARLKWLVKAFRMAEEGRAFGGELYNIVSARKFVAGVPSRIGRKLAALVRENLDTFSEKQQRYLKSRECPLNASYPREPEARKDNSEDEGGDAAARMEEMMARCRAFVREKANTFEDRAAEVAETERRAREQALLDFEHARLLAEDVRLHQRAREEQERVLREAREAEERARREAQEREERQRQLTYEAEMARRRAQEEEAARKRRLELEVDSSMMLVLERGGAAAAEPPVAKQVLKAASNNDKQRGLSRSRSVSSGGARRSRSAERRRRKRGSSSSSSARRKRRKRDRQDDGKWRGRRKKSSSSSSSGKSS